MLLRITPVALTLCLAACTLKVGDLGELTDASSSDSSAGPGTSSGPGSETETEATDVSSDTDMVTTGDLAPVTGVDILFVIDNSGSMASHQQRLGDALPALAGPLTAAGLDLRIAVTTTDVGNPRCVSAPPNQAEAGEFQTRSCREAIDTGDWMFNDVDSSSACTDICTHASIAYTQTATAEDPTPKIRPWIESSAGGGNIQVPLDEALACVLPQGIAGCGFESPLESMYLALARTQDPSAPEFGFLRTDADLLIVIVSDEADCSGNPEFKGIFTDNMVFWGAGQLAPTSAACWRAGMRCDGGPGTYDDCVAVDRDVTGAETQDPTQAVLQPLSRYQGVLSSILAGKTNAGSSGKVHVAAITGVPIGYPQSPLVFADAVDPDVQTNFGIGPGCASGDVIAVPPGRIREVVEQTAPLGPGLFSICDPSFDDSLGALAAGLLAD